MPDIANISRNVKLSEESKCITKSSNRRTYDNYGIIKMSSIYNVEYRWDFIINSETGGKIQIGIASKDYRYTYMY